MIEANPYTAGGYQVLKVETHLHTLHSDGQDSVEAMFSACLSAGYDAVALTDHNTLSGLDVARDAVAGLGLILIPGVEVTTFRGHAVVLGVTRVPEWRDLESRGMDALAEGVHADGGLLCVAHPAALGERRLLASRGARLDFWLQRDGEAVRVGGRASGGNWTPRVEPAAVIKDIRAPDGSRALYAERRDAQGRLEAISAPIWIDTST